MAQLLVIVVWTAASCVRGGSESVRASGCAGSGGGGARAATRAAAPWCAREDQETCGIPAAEAL